MLKLHYCNNGRSVTDQVVLFQVDRKDENYKPIRAYYDNYKDIWYKQLCDYLDRPTFDSDFEFKLSRAVDTFNETEAKALAKKNGWSHVGMFNRWFYRILSNWKSNVKTSSVRVKRKPPVVCPVCGRSVGKIDEEHLQHYKSTKDLPRFLEYEDKVYPVYLSPRQRATCFGSFSNAKLDKMNDGETKEYMKTKKTLKWPWFTDDRKKGVICPYTKKVVLQITNDYLKTLSKRLNRYATPISWQQFIELYPSSLIQSEIYSLDYSLSDVEDETFGDQVVANKRIEESGFCISIEEVQQNKSNEKVHDLFELIDYFLKDSKDREIAKMLAGGHSVEDICQAIKLDKNDVKRRIIFIRDNAQGLKETLLEVV